MKKHLDKILIVTAVIIILVLCYMCGGNAPSLRGLNAVAGETDSYTEQAKLTEIQRANESDSTELSKTPEQTTEIQKPDEKVTVENKPANKDSTATTAQEKPELTEIMADNSSFVESQEMASGSTETETNIESTDKDKYQTATVPKGMPVPIEPQNETISDEKHTCTLSVCCDTVLNNIAWLAPEKAEIVPKDGVIFASRQVEFYEGESVFNLLKREMKKSKIHLEFVNTPIYNSAYIEGIANLYEFDCGELSGWMYRVNGWFPNYGCSRYKLKQDDNVEWVYTCDLGNDVGGYFNSDGEQKNE